MCCFKVTLTRLYNLSKFLNSKVARPCASTRDLVTRCLGDSVTRCLKKILIPSIPQLLKSSDPSLIPIRKLHIEIAYRTKKSAV